MLEEVTGESYELLLKKKLLQPLGMSSAGFRAPAQNGFVDQPYRHIKRLFWDAPIDPEPKGDNPGVIAPAGAVHGSVVDFAKYVQFYLGVTGKTILLEENREVLCTPISIKDYAMGNYGEKEGFKKCDEAIGYLMRTYLENSQLSRLIVISKWQLL